MKLHRFHTLNINESVIDEKKLMPSEFLQPMVEKIKEIMSKSKDDAKWAEETAANLNKIHPRSAVVAQDGPNSVVYYIHPEQMSVAMVIHQDEVVFFRRLSRTKQVDKDVPESIFKDRSKGLAHEPLDAIKFDDLKEGLITASDAKKWVKSFIQFINKAWQEDAEIEIVDQLGQYKEHFERAPMSAWDYFQRWNEKNKEVLDRIIGNRTTDQFAAEYEALLQNEVSEGLNPRDLRSANKAVESRWEDYISKDESKAFVAKLQEEDPDWYSNKSIGDDHFSSHRNRFIDAVVADIAKGGKLDKKTQEGIEDIIIDICSGAESKAHYKSDTAASKANRKAKIDRISGGWDNYDGSVDRNIQSFESFNEMQRIPSTEGEVLLFNTKDVKKDYDKTKKENPGAVGYLKMLQKRIDAKPGYEHYVDYSSGPFGGSETFEVTRVEPNGDVFGVSKSGGAYELDPEDVI